VEEREGIHNLRKTTPVITLLLLLLFIIKTHLIKVTLSRTKALQGHFPMLLMMAGYGPG